MKLAVTQLQRGPCQKLIISFAAITNAITVETECFNLSNLAEVQFKFILQRETTGRIIPSISWKKHASVPLIMNQNVQIRLKCEQLQCLLVLPCKIDWSGWKKIGEFTETRIVTVEHPGTETSTATFFNALNITLIVSQVERITFLNLYQEIDFCDFHLKSADSKASVPVHKACISLHSDVFKRMFLCECKETKNGCIEIVGVTLQTLQDLKKYIYMGILPDDTVQLQSLLLIAKCYMINNLMAECIRSLALSIKPEDLYDLQEFAIDNKLPELIRAIVQIVPDETVQIAYQMENEKKVGLMTISDKIDENKS